MYGEYQTTDFSQHLNLLNQQITYEQNTFFVYKKNKFDKKMSLNPITRRQGF
jgi:hypothetical protein